jgi:drug/metabolite transporter (DMT)-like permease
LSHGPGAAHGPDRTATLAGIAWMLSATSAIALVDALAKYLARHLHGVQVAWGYFTAMLVCLVVVLACRRVDPGALLRSRRPWLQWARAACLVMSLCCLFFSLRYLPLAEATTIGFTAPLFIVALSGPMLGEPVGARRWTAVLVGMCGAIIVARPGTGLLHWSALLALVGAFFFAQFNIVTRKLGGVDAVHTTLLYTFALGAAMLSLAMPLLWRTPSAREWGLLLLAGGLGLFAHFAIVRSLALADASAVAPLNYIRLVWAIGIGMVVFGDRPDLLSLLGGAITVGSGLYVLYSAVR